MSEREELIQIVRNGAVPALSYEVGASIADDILESDWLERHSFGTHQNGYWAGYCAGRQEAVNVPF